MLKCTRTSIGASGLRADPISSFFAPTMCSMRAALSGCFKSSTATHAYDSRHARGKSSSGAVTEDRENLYAEFAGKPYLKGTILERMLWDFRMAFAFARERTAGCPVKRSKAVYFPQLAVPVAAAGSAFWRLRRLA